MSTRNTVEALILRDEVLHLFTLTIGAVEASLGESEPRTDYAYRSSVNRT